MCPATGRYGARDKTVGLDLSSTRESVTLQREEEFGREIVNKCGIFSLIKGFG